MDAKTLEALKGSIEKWEGRAAGTWLQPNTMNCPLCQLFNTAEDPTNDDYSGCSGCPVYAFTGNKYCADTPCEQYYNDLDGPKIAAAEVAFLKSLLPPEMLNEREAQ